VLLEGQDLLRQVYNCTAPGLEARLIRPMPFKLMPKPNSVAARGKRPKVHTGRVFLTLLQVAPPPSSRCDAHDGGTLAGGLGASQGSSASGPEDDGQGHGEDGLASSSSEESEWSDDDDGDAGPETAARASRNASSSGGGTASRSGGAAGAELAFARAAAAHPEAKLALRDGSAAAWGLPLMVPHGAVLVEINRVTLKPPVEYRGRAVPPSDASATGDYAAASVPSLDLAEARAGGATQPLTAAQASEAAAAREVLSRAKNATQLEKRCVEFTVWDGPPKGAIAAASGACGQCAAMPHCCTVRASTCRSKDLHPKPSHGVSLELPLFLARR
jgi:hypothetical protein